MKASRSALALLIFIITVHVAFLLPQRNGSSEVRAGYTPSTCPGAIKDARALLLLPSKEQSTKNLKSLKADFQTRGAGTVPVKDGAILIAGDPRNTIEIQTKVGKWTSAVTCRVGESESWFVGGTAGVTSQGKILFDNSGLSDATVEVLSFSEKGPSNPISYTIKAASELAIRLDSINPGAGKFVTRVKVINGRVTTFLLDERVKGLTNLGADFVAPTMAPATTVIIPGLPATLGKKSTVAHVLRLMATGSLDGTASVEIISSNGVFVPVGLGEIPLNSQEVFDIPLTDIKTGSKDFGLRITATTEIVAGVFTQGKQGSMSDFSWQSAVAPFQLASFNLYGIEANLTIIGKQISLLAEWSDNRGKTFRENLKGDEIVNWRIPPNSRLLRLTDYSGSYATLSWQTADGITSLPVTSGSVMASATRPISDLSVIQP